LAKCKSVLVRLCLRLRPRLLTAVCDGCRLQRVSCALVALLRGAAPVL
jgi:hypothetical protein